MKYNYLLFIKNTILGIIILLISQSLKAANLYVSNSGSDTNAGTISSPFLTIQTALNVATPGDIINVRAGTYAEKLWWPSSGTSGSPITLTNYNGETAILSGVNPTNSTQGGFIVISTKSYIRINGLIFRDNIMNYADGVYVTGSGTDIHITNCEFDNIGWTASKTTFPSPSNSAHAIIFVGSTSTSLNNIFIGGNYIHDCITGYSESVTIAGNVENFLIEGNTLNSNTNIGIDAAGHFTWTGAPANVNYARSGIIRDNVVSNYAGPAALDAAGGIYTDGGSYITIENNTVYNYKVGYSIGCEVAANSNTGNIFRNNVAYNCSLSGLFLGSNTSSMVYNTQVYNNTFYNCGTGTYDNGQIALQNNSGSDIRNNIMVPSNGRMAMVQMGGTSSSSLSLAYNLFWRPNETTSAMFYNISGDVNSVLANPSFTNASAGNFHILSSSPAVNAGDPSYSPGSDVTDMDGATRKQGGRVDIGADETGSSSSTTSVTSVSVSPTNAALTVGGTQSLLASVSPSNATNKNVSWSTSNSSVATVNSSGGVTAKSVGSVTITVTTADGSKKGTSSITVSSDSTGGGDTPTLVSHDFNDGEMGSFVDCTTQNPNYAKVVNNRLQTYWKESSYNSTDRMTKGAEACGDPSNNGIGYLTHKYCWMGFTINIDEDYMGSSYNGVGGLAQIFGFDDANGKSSWTAMLEIENGNLTWQDRRGQGNTRAEVIVYENFPKGVDVDIVVHAVLSDNYTGQVEIFVNGVLAYSAYNIRIGMGEYDGNDTQTNLSYSEFKIGQYNHSSAADNEIRIIDYDNVSWYNGADGYDLVDPSDGSGSNDQTICAQFAQMDIQGGEFKLNNNVWGATTDQCVTYNGETAWTVSSSAHDQSTVASYPFIGKGCHYGACTDNSGMPIKVSEISDANVSYSISSARPSGMYNAMAECWLSASTSTVDGYAGGAEILIGMDYQGGMEPCGSVIGTFNGYDVHYCDIGWNFVQYVKNGQSSINIDIKDFIDDAVSRGYVETSWYLHNMQAGFELMRGGAGLTANSFSFNVNANPTDGGTISNLALNKSVTSTGTADGTNIANNLVDGSTSNRWSVSGFPQSATIDLGAVYNLSSTELVCYSDRAYQYTVEASTTSGGSYSQIVNRSNNSTAGTVSSPIKDNISVSARYVRITVTGASGYTGTWVSLAEFRVFGSEGGPSTVAVTGVSVSPTSVSLTVGETQLLSALVSPSNATNKSVSWSTSNSSVATVNSSGVVSAKSAGSTTITATTTDGNKKDMNSITVTSGSTGGSNLALNGTATQSSVSWSGEPSRAIDGNTNGVWSGGSVTHTANESNAWWMVNLGNNQNIVNITIYNRTDLCCKARLANFTVSVLNSNGSTTYSQSFTAYPNPSITVNTGGVTGNRVKITSNLTNTPLSLAEVEVYGNQSAKTALTKNTSYLNSTDYNAVLHPNPATNELNIKLSNAAKTTEIIVFNNLGQMLISEEFNNEIHSVSINKLPSGIYVIKITIMDNQQVITKRFIKQ